MDAGHDPPGLFAKQSQFSGTRARHACASAGMAPTLRGPICAKQSQFWGKNKGATPSPRWGGPVLPNKANSRDRPERPQGQSCKTKPIPVPGERWAQPALQDSGGPCETKPIRCQEQKQRGFMALGAGFTPAQTGAGPACETKPNLGGMDHVDKTEQRVMSGHQDRSSSDSLEAGTGAVGSGCVGVGRVPSR